MDQTRGQTESNRQALIRAIMEDRGISHHEAEQIESERFCNAMAAFIKSGSIVRRRKPQA